MVKDSSLISAVSITPGLPECIELSLPAELHG